jgi:tetratricopeptide (TPR) repeat protein
MLSGRLRLQLESEGEQSLTMPNDDTTKDLSARIAALEERLTRVQELLELKFKTLENIRENDSANFDKQLSLYAQKATETEALRSKVNNRLFQIFAFAAAVVLGLTIVGIKTAQDFIAVQTKRVSTVLDAETQNASRRMIHLTDYEFDYANGTGLLSAKSYKAAIPYLRRCFDADPYNPSAISPLLNAIDQSADYELGRQIVDELKIDSTKYDNIQDVLALNNIGLIEVDIGSQHSEYLPLAHRALEKARQLVPEGDEEDRRYIYQNLWLYAILTRNHLEAERSISELLRVNDPALDTWEQVAAYPFLKAFLATNSEGVFAKSSWKTLEVARKQTDSHQAASSRPRTKHH